MGTQGSITVYDEDGKDIANIVTQYDGYELSDWVARFVSGKQLTNGISNDYDFNGMGDLAARLIAALKNQRYKGDIGQPVKPGNVYLYDTPYETDYHITLVYQGEGKKPKMTVSTPEWTDNYYDRTVLPPLGEANVRMQGAETFNAEKWEYTDEWYDSALPRIANRINDKLKWTDEMENASGSESVKDERWHNLVQRNVESALKIEYPELTEQEINEIINEGGMVSELAYSYDFEAETFNSYKVAPALSSYSKDELISSKAGPQGSASYDEMVYDPIAQDRLSAESKKMCVVCNEKPVDYSHPNTLGALCSTPKCLHYVFDAESFASDEDRRLKAFAKKIENEKKKLVKKAKRSGLYENFGQKEVHKLEDSISDLDYYEQQKYQEMIRDFDDWANSIDLRGLERYAESFASETSSTLKSMGYVAGTIGVGYLIFQRFVKDRLDETMNQ